MQIDSRLKTLHDPKSLLYKTVVQKKMMKMEKTWPIIFSDSEGQKVRKLTVKSTKYFWLFSPTQLLTLKLAKENQLELILFRVSLVFSERAIYHGQWWSIFRMHLWHTEQWWARSGLILQHFGHLKNTCPSLKPSCWITSLVALPFGTAPCKQIDSHFHQIIDRNLRYMSEWEKWTHRIRKHGSDMWCICQKWQ